MLKIKKSRGEYAFGIFNICFLTFLMVITIYPLLHVLFASFSNPLLLIKHEGLLLKPLGFSIQGYKLVFKNEWIISGYINTFFYVIIGTTMNIFITALLAFPLSRKNLLWNKVIMFIIVFTMFFGGGLIPTYLLIRNLGLIDTRWSVILPVLISTWNLFIMRTSFASIPESLIESAKIDGANDITVLFKIILPLSVPIIAVMILFYGVQHWNSWFNAMIYIRDRTKYPLQIILREILIEKNTNDMTFEVVDNQTAMDEVLKYATIIVATVPILLLYPFLQKYFVKGVMVGAIKG